MPRSGNSATTVAVTAASTASSPPADASTCFDCKQSKPKKEFSASQRAQPANARRCSSCIVNAEKVKKDEQALQKLDEAVEKLATMGEWYASQTTRSQELEQLTTEIKQVVRRWKIVRTLIDSSRDVTHEVSAAQLRLMKEEYQLIKLTLLPAIQGSKDLDRLRTMFQHRARESQATSSPSASQ